MISLEMVMNQLKIELVVGEIVIFSVIIFFSSLK